MNLISQKIDFRQLQTVKGAAFDAYDNPHDECLPGTREALLEEINDWAKKSDGKCIFWLQGMAGTGKSTISRTMAARLRKQQLLGASFFFKRGEEDRGTAKRLFPTLIEQLVISVPQLIPSVQKAIDDDPLISEKGLGDQFRNLILNPFLEAQQSIEQSPTIIVIDALDECDRDSDIVVLLKLLPLVQAVASTQLRFLLTSRPELHLRLGFRDITGSHQDFVLHEIPEPVIEHDITLYIKHQLDQLRKRRSLPATWPSATNTNTLIKRSIPLFIAAVTLCRFLGDPNWRPNKRLEVILSDQSRYITGMDSTYIPVLKHILSGDDEENSQQLASEFKEIVGVIVILANPLSVNSLSRLIENDPDDVQCRLEKLHSVLSVPEDLNKPVRLLHLSFREFLLDHRKINSEFHVDEKQVNQRLATRCIRLMRHDLKRNICNLPSPGTKRNEISLATIQQHISPELNYACRYWVHHFIQCASPSCILSEVYSFFEEHFLHWVEVMSILGLISELIRIVLSLQKTRNVSLANIEACKNLTDLIRLIKMICSTISLTMPIFFSCKTTRSSTGRPFRFTMQGWCLQPGRRQSGSFSEKKSAYHKSVNFQRLNKGKTLRCTRLRAI